MSNSRGFSALVGETITQIDAIAINIVMITCASGKVVEIDCDEQHYNIGVLHCNEVIKAATPSNPFPNFNIKGR